MYTNSNNNTDIIDTINRIKSIKDKVFYTMEDVRILTGWSKTTVQKLFNDPAFPSTNYGRQKVVLREAFIAYFSVPRRRENSRYWRSDTKKEVRI